MIKNMFDRYRNGSFDLKNRVVMAPMTRARSEEDGTPNELMATYYAQRAEAGLIVSEAVNISPEGSGFLKTPSIYSDRHVDGWQRVTDAVHNQGGRFFMQLWHVGRIGHPENMLPGLHPVAPSAIPFDRLVVTANGQQPVPVPRALSTAEVGQTVEDFARAAYLAVAAGCDGVEIHAANGYLPSQFLHESSNHRTDAYGGSLAKRARFVIELAQACALAVGSSRVGVRLTPFNVFNGAYSADDAQVYQYLIPSLAELDLGYLHVVGTEVSGNQSVQIVDGKSGVDVLGFVRPLWPHLLIAAGEYDLARAQADITRGRADLIAFGRDFIANPDLVTRLREGHQLTERRPSDWYGSGAKGYIDYPHGKTNKITNGKL